MSSLDYLNEPLPAGPDTSATILQGLLEKNWKMKETDRDMILMLHEIGYELDDKSHLFAAALW